MGQYLQAPAAIIYDFGAFGLGAGIWRISFPNGRTTVIRTSTGLITCDIHGNATLNGYERRYLTTAEAVWLNSKAVPVFGRGSGLDFKQLCKTAIETSTMDVELAN